MGFLFSRDFLVFLGIVVWLLVAFVRLGGIKRRLNVEFGADKAYDFYSEKAKGGHQLARALIHESRILFGVAIVGGVFIAFTK